MSGDTSRFKMKKGDIEIEYEGSSEDVKGKFSEIFEWLKEASSISTPQLTPSKTNETVTINASEVKTGKQDKRGGSRSSVISPAVDKLVDQGFLDSFKTPEVIYAELKRQNVVASLGAVVEALKRRVPKTLDRIQDEGKWVYRKKPSSG